jgi:hypothetical protein
MIIPWPNSSNEVYRPGDRRLSTKLMSTFADRRLSRGEIDGSLQLYSRFLDRSRYFFFQVAPQLYSRSWVDPVPDPLLLRKSGSAANRTLDFWTTEAVNAIEIKYQIHIFFALRCRKPRIWP